MYITNNSKPERASLSPGELKLRRMTHKRQSAAQFIESQLGTRVPWDSDESFRASLADGAVLCQLLNTFKPGIISRVELDAATPTSGVRHTFENVTNFLEAAQEFTTELFSAADLEETGERPQVVECILSLQDWYHASFAATPACKRSIKSPEPEDSSNTTCAAVTAAASVLPSDAHCVHTPPVGGASFSFTPQAAELVRQHGPGGVGGQSDGLNYLMQSCTHMLKTRMGIPATPLPLHAGLQHTHPEIALDAVGPVLETVLANLTTEYERRLLSKDQEHKMQADAVEGLRRQVSALQEEVAHWRRCAAESDAAGLMANQATEDDALKAQERVEYERLRQAEVSLVCELAAKRRELEEAQAEASKRNDQAEAALTALRLELQQYNGMQERYKAMHAENRELYNTVQDLRGSIRVFCRVRPHGATGDHSASVLELGDDGDMAVYSHKHNKWHEYKFDRVFGENSTQKEVYQETKPLVRSVLDGYNVCIFAYGQTGSGKTYTMSGCDETAAGVNYCALNDLFEQRDERAGEVEYSIRVQLLEVYNEAVRDLLVPHEASSTSSSSSERGPNSGQHSIKGLTLKATRGSGSNVPDATQVEVHSADEVEDIMARGARNRAVAETKLNDRSSRSHQILTVMVEGLSVATHARTFGCLHLIDLAGSERVAKSGAQGQQLLEAQHINRSLTALGCVMQALAQKREHVPFRDSKLTQLLQDSLAGQAKSMMFMHVAPEGNSASETLSTLNFGRGVTEITLGAAQRNAESGAAWELKDKLNAARREAEEERGLRMALEKEIAALQEQIDQCKTNNSIAAYRPSTRIDIEDAEDRQTPEGRSREGMLIRPPQVARLNLAKLGGTPLQHQGGVPSSSGKIESRPPSSPRSALLASKIPTPLSSSSSFGRRRSGSLTARPSIGGNGGPLSSGSPPPKDEGRRSGDGLSGLKRPLTSRKSSPVMNQGNAMASCLSVGTVMSQRSQSGLSSGSHGRSGLHAPMPAQTRRWQ